MEFPSTYRMSATGRPLAPPYPENIVRAFEQRNDVTLHPLLRQYLTKVSSDAFTSAYRVHLDMSGKCEGTNPITEPDVYVYSDQDEEEENADPYNGALYFAEGGCTFDGYVIIRGPLKGWVVECTDEDCEIFQCLASVATSFQAVFAGINTVNIDIKNGQEETTHSTKMGKVDQATELLAPRGQRDVLPSRFQHVAKVGLHDGKGISFLRRLNIYYPQEVGGCLSLSSHDFLCVPFTGPVRYPLNHVIRGADVKDNVVSAYIHNQEKQGMVYIGFESRQDFEDLLDDMERRLAAEKPADHKLFKQDAMGRWCDTGSYSERIPAAFVGYNHFLDRITKDVQTFRRNRAILAKMGETNKSLNYLLYGPPGTGKTTLVMTFASMHNYPVYVVNRNTREAVSLSPKNPMSPVTVLLFEDFDRCLTQRLKDNDMKGEGSSYMSDVLNTLDGVNSGEGIVRFFTGNDCATIFDTPALVNRMSACFHLDFPTREMLGNKLDFMMKGAEEAITQDDSEAAIDAQRMLRDRLLDAVKDKVTLRPFSNFVARHIFDHNPLTCMLKNVEDELLHGHVRRVDNVVNLHI